MSVKQRCPAAGDISVILCSGFELDRHLGRHMFTVLPRSSVPWLLEDLCAVHPAHRVCRRLQLNIQSGHRIHYANAKDETEVPVLTKDGARAIGGTSRRPKVGQGKAL
jgi:hypothetical protein